MKRINAESMIYYSVNVFRSFEVYTIIGLQVTCDELGLMLLLFEVWVSLINQRLSETRYQSKEVAIF